MSNEPAITIRGLEVAYEVRRLDPSRPWYRGLLRSTIVRKEVLKGLDFTATGAGISAVLGRNGAGKTTLIKAMTGILTPSAGEISVLGYRPSARKRGMLRRIGVIFGHKRAMWEELSLRENLAVTASVYGVDRAAAARRRDELVVSLGLTELLDRPVKTYSLGEAMKAEIANVFLFEPCLIFLDEPTIGLDIAAQTVIRRAIQDEVARRGTHVVLTSHNLRDIAELATAIWFIENGRTSRFALGNGSREGLERTLERRLLSP
jgi:ABC-2 type transport system ATP-binding protein